jgi:predicted ATPase
VSQVLPLVVEFLSKGKNERFAVQQPEVHLHPRAQAALGDLLFAMADEKGHSFVIETHSDFLIDRFRYALSKGKAKIDSQVVFFSRREGGNQVKVIPIDGSGQYPTTQPKEFREFFINEDLKMLDF